MLKVNVLVAHHLARPEDIAAIAAVHPSVNVTHAPFVDEMTRAWVQSFREDAIQPVLDVKGVEFERQAGTAEIIFALGLPKDIVLIAPNLAWVHAYSAGVDYLAGTGLLEKGVKLTSSSGVNSAPIAEFCMMFMLMYVKRMTTRLAAQRQHQWARYTNEELRGRTVGIVGLGRIGSEVAKRASAFGMHVLAAKRSSNIGEGRSFVDELYDRDRLHEMIGRCDFVVVAVSLTNETVRLIGAAEFSAMKRGTFFINVSRGAVVDEQALIEALRSGHLGGAGLDVFENEPLPPTSPLWALPNVIVTAHNSGSIREHAKRATHLFCENLLRYLNERPLENEVDPQKGY
ncbi:MAG: D-2-hydroxyacid dehydrogenase [Chloroflexi bacterium]|nr:D-2-hydroxyacid dehydrogenase [Chloroflexota bacterium]